MERREPTLAGSDHNDRDDVPVRRGGMNYDDEPRSNRKSTSYAPPSSSPLPAIALVVGLIGVGAAGFLGWMLTETQAKLEKDAARIQQLENQLNVTSSESTQSVTALGINLQKLDGDVKKLAESSRKSLADHTDKLSSLSKNLDGAKADISVLKGDTNSLKQDSLAHKANLEDLSPRVDALDKNSAEQRKKLQDTSASLNAIIGQVKSAEGLAARITKTEEAIDAIDDNRRTLNKDVLQIKQQLGIKN